MIEWLIWFVYALIPAIITIAADLELRTLTILYFIAVLGAMIFWYIRDRVRAKKPDAI